MRQLLFIRHGQRLDRYFSDAYPKVREWTAKCFSSSGSYIQVNIETPLYLPNRGRIELYADDPPLTVGGEMSAQLLGNKLAASQIRVTSAYSSPALRCVQTSYRILQGQADVFGGSVGPIKIDGGLYEFGSATTGGLAFAEPKFLYERGLPVDLSYKNSIEVDELRHLLWESYADFRKRAGSWIEKILSSSASKGTILFVSHASTILTFVRELIQKPMSEETLDQVINIPPSLTTILLEEQEHGKWVLPVVQPFPSFEIRCKSSFNQKWLDKTQYEHFWD